MNNFKYLSLILLFVVLSCQESGRDDKLETKEIEIKEFQEPKQVIIEENIVNSSIETFLDIETLYPGKFAVEKKDSNMDHDTAIEQFIILIDELNLITIVVADFNKITREYFPAWEKQLPLIYNADFLMTEQDVLAYKRNLELVISGTTITNKNALYIFQKTAPPKGIHIYYKTIFSNESSGTVELVTQSRSLDYNESRKDSDKAYDVLVEKSNMLNENTIVVIKENWAWDKRKNIFVKESSDTIEQKINVKEKLTALYTGSKVNFIKFISGEWYLEGKTNDDGKIIIIDQNKNQVVLKYEDGVEEYNIYRSWKSFQKLTLNLKNRDITTIPKQFNITLNSTDQFTITNNNPTAWDGQYTRLNNEIKDELISNTNTEIKKDIPFTGIYKNVLYSINFSYPEYSKISPEDGTIEEGLFTFLELNNNLLVLQLKAKTNLRSVYNITNYLFTYSEQKLDSQAIRTIKIHEGVLTTHGIEVKSNKTPMRFEQTEVISNE